MMIRVLLFLLALSSVHADARVKYEKNSACKTCHPVIYDEYQRSMHQKSTIFSDPIHKAVWDRHPKNKKAQQYTCGKCHTPAADNISDMLIKGKKALPDQSNQTQQEAVSCAYCHRIKSITLDKQSNSNVMSKSEHHYYGTLENAVKSDFHTVDTKNENFKNGNVCIGCHSHKANKAGLNVCSTNIRNELDQANCVTCHMPKVSGAVSTVSATAKHSFHGFPGTHNDQNMLTKYIQFSIEKKQNSFILEVENKSAHALLLHPLRMAKLHVKIIRNDKIINLPEQVFTRNIGKNGKVTPPWIAEVVVQDTQLHGNEIRKIHYKMALERNDKLEVTLGYFLVKPKSLNALGLEKDTISKKFYILKEERIEIK